MRNEELMANFLNNKKRTRNDLGEEIWMKYQKKIEMLVHILKKLEFLFLVSF